MAGLDELQARFRGALAIDALSPEPIERPALERLVAAAVAASAHPRQSPAVRVLILEGEEKEALVAQLAEAIARHWEGGDTAPSGLASDAILRAPVLAVVLNLVPSWESPGTLSRAAAVAHNLQLFAAEEGLGAYRVVRAHVVSESVLAFAERHLGSEAVSAELVSLLAIGRPAALQLQRDPLPPPSVVRFGDTPVARVGACGEPPRAPAPVLRANGVERILVADPQHCARSRLVAMLTAAGYEVELAATAAEVRTKVREGNLHLALIAESLPDAPGIEVVRRHLRGAEAHGQIPALIVTSRRDAAYRIAGLAAGVDYYLRRPILPVELYTVTRLLLDRHRLVEDLQDANREQARLLRELRQAQTQLVQHAKMAALGQLVAGVAHEVNTPLGAVVSNNDLFLRRLPRLNDASDRSSVFEETERLRRLAEVSREACARIQQVVHTLRTFARVDHEDPQAIDLHQSLDTTLALIAHLTQPNIDVVRRYGELPPVSVRPNQLHQVLMNLLVNACQAMGERGTLTLTTESYGDEIELRVTDTGVGIPTDNLQKIFDPGFTTKGPAVGTGLGLAIVYQIVTEHGGQILVDSEPGKGSEFTVRLPVHRPKLAVSGRRL